MRTHIHAAVLKFLIIFLLFTSVSLAQEQQFGQVFLTDQRIREIKQDIREQRQPAYGAFLELRDYISQHSKVVPDVPQTWYVPGFYKDAEGHRRAKNGLRDQANTAYALALKFRLTGEKKYAEKSVRLIRAWSTGLDSMSKKDDSTLSFSYHFPAMIFAADLLRGQEVWPQDSQRKFELFLREKALPMHTMDRENNWGNWGLVLVSAIATYLQDESLFRDSVARWKYFIEHQIAEDGHLPHEVNRSGGMRGIWYSHFTLMPQTVAAEILSVNGADLYSYESPSRRNLRMAFKKIAEWTHSPETFPYWDGETSELRGVDYYSYFEILNSHYPNRDAEALLVENRPMTANHSAPFLTLTHGEPIE
jgi:hypothetical protein